MGARVAHRGFEIPIGIAICQVASRISPVGVYVSSAPLRYHIGGELFAVGTLKTASIRGKPRGP